MPPYPGVLGIADRLAIGLEEDLLVIDRAGELQVRSQGELPPEGWVEARGAESSWSDHGARSALRRIRKRLRRRVGAGLLIVFDTESGRARHCASNKGLHVMGQSGRQLHQRLVTERAQAMLAPSRPLQE
jgi:hypothetical protein